MTMRSEYFFAVYAAVAGAFLATAIMKPMHQRDIERQWDREFARAKSREVGYAAQEREAVLEAVKYGWHAHFMGHSLPELLTDTTNLLNRVTIQGNPTLPQ